MLFGSTGVTAGEVVVATGAGVTAGAVVVVGAGAGITEVVFCVVAEFEVINAPSI